MGAVLASEKSQTWQLLHTFTHMKRKNSFALGKSPAHDQVAATSLKTQPWKKLRSETRSSPLCYLHLAPPSNSTPSFLPALPTSFTAHSGCIPKSTIKFPLCLCGRWQMHGGHLVFPRQAGHLLWLMLGCGKKWAGKELQWKACRLEGDILISPALSSRLAFGDETPSGGKRRGYWCKTAWNALCQVAVH